MLYILHYSYVPNSASNNRLMGFYKTIDTLGVKATLIYFAPNITKSKMAEIYNNIRIEYHYNEYFPYKKFIKKILVERSIKKFIKRLSSDDIVYTYTISKLTKECQSVKGVKVYAEMTEHPEACMCVGDPSILLDKESFADTVRSLSGLFVISRPLKNYFSSLGLQESKIQIINMTVDEDRFIGTRKQNKAERYIAYCGTASNTKDGVDELIKAFALVYKEIPEIYLYIIGKTPRKDERFGNLELVKRLGLGERVKFTGIVSSNKIPQLLKDADVLALDRPDNLQAKYGFPTKLGEYLLTENPVVVTSVGDIPYFLSDGISALIAKPSSPEEFSQKLIWALKNVEKARIIGQKGAMVARKNFNSRNESMKMIHFMQLM